MGATELASLARVAERQSESGLEGAGDLLGAQGGARSALGEIELRGQVRDHVWGQIVEGNVVLGLSREARAARDAVAAPVRVELEHRHRHAVVPPGDEDECPRIGGEGNPSQHPGQPALRIERGCVAAAGGRGGERSRRRVHPGLRQGPPREQRLRERHRSRVAGGDPHDPEAVGEARAGATVCLGHPRERQTGRLQGVPQLSRPLSLLRTIHHLGRAVLLEHPRESLDQQRVGGAHRPVNLGGRRSPIACTPSAKSSLRRRRLCSASS